MAALSVETILYLLLLLAVSGIVVGFLSGLFGIGGGGILVPVLFETFRIMGVDESIRMHMAVGTALAAMVPTTIASYRSHLKRANVDVGIIRRMAVPVVLGVVVGSVIAKFSPGVVLTVIWVVVGSFMAIKQFAGTGSLSLGDDVPKSWGLEAYGMVVGVLSTLMSVGGGAFVTTMMTLYKRPIQQAVGTSSGFGPIIALPGIIGFIWAGWSVTGTPPGTLGYVSFLSAACMVPFGVLAAPWGARVAAGMSRRSLEIGFGIFMTVVVLKFIADLTII
jgi:uncharacterized membrane protein YfcA